MLAGLVEANYLYRTSDKSYVLGAGLARIAFVAQKHLEPLQVAKSEMRTLADELDAICSAVYADRGEAVVRDQASSVSHIGWSTRMGQRHPIAPPFGGIFLAWAKPAEVERWLARAPEVLSEDDRKAYIASLDFPRRYGFAVGLRREMIRDEAHAEWLALKADKTDYTASDIDPDATYNLGFVAAPVFDAEGNVYFLLSLTGFVDPMTGAQVEKIGQKLRASCDRLTIFLGGKNRTPTHPAEV
jgi:DNA-binding IclR family transcriptional regulator